MSVIPPTSVNQAPTPGQRVISPFTAAPQESWASGTPAPDPLLVRPNVTAAPAAHASPRKKLFLGGLAAAAFGIAAAVTGTMGHHTAPPVPPPVPTASAPVPTQTAPPPVVTQTPAPVTPVPVTPAPINNTAVVRGIVQQNTAALNGYLTGQSGVPVLSSQDAQTRFNTLVNFFEQNQSGNSQLTPQEKAYAANAQLYLQNVDARAQAYMNQVPQAQRAPFSHYQAAVIVSDYQRTGQVQEPGLYVAGYELGAALRAGR